MWTRPGADWPFGWKAFERFTAHVTDILQAAALRRISYALDIQQARRRKVDLVKTGKIARPTATGRIARPTTGPISKADLSGQIEVFSLYEVFEMLSSGRKSGVLKLVTRLGEGRCTLNRGSVLSASILRLSDGEAVIE